MNFQFLKSGDVLDTSYGNCLVLLAEKNNESTFSAHLFSPRHARYMIVVVDENGNDVPGFEKNPHHISIEKLKIKYIIKTGLNFDEVLKPLLFR